METALITVSGVGNLCDHLTVPNEPGSYYCQQCDDFVVRARASVEFTAQRSSGRSINLVAGPTTIYTGTFGGSSMDAYSEKFDLERTEHCWRDGCSQVSDTDSETGLCVEHRTELRDRWKHE